ncbi:MAG: hypothetical protein ACK4PR_09650 [Gammaproteobacteria bacterium]
MKKTIITLILSINCIILSSAWGATEKLSDYITPVDNNTVTQLQQAALHDPSAAYQLGIFYLNGDIDPEHYAENKNTYNKLAIQYLQQAAAANYAPAEVALAGQYYDGSIVPYNGKAALTLIQKAAQSNSSTAQATLAYYYNNGILVPQNDELAYKYTILAASNDTATTYSTTLFDDINDILSGNERTTWMKKIITKATVAADNDDKYTIDTLCNYYDDHPLAEGNQNFTLAKKWCSLSAKQWLINYNFMANLARSQQNYALELMWLQQGALHDNTSSEFSLLYYYTRHQITPAELVTMQKIVKKLYNETVTLQQQGQYDSNALLILLAPTFTMDQNKLLPDSIANIKAKLQQAINTVVAHNDYSAMESTTLVCSMQQFSDLNACNHIQQYLDLGVKHNNRWAIYKSGVHDLMNGKLNNNPALLKQGVNLLQTALDNNIKDALLYLIPAYEGTFDIPGFSAKNLTHILQYSEVVAFAYPGQEDELGHLYLTGTAVPKNIDKGIALCTQAANEGNPMAALYLAQIYSHGIYNQKIDWKKAMKFANLAVDILQVDGASPEDINGAKALQESISFRAKVHNLF